MRVSLPALFLVRRPRVFKAVGQPGPDATEAVVLVSNRKGEQRKLELRRERGEWRIHHPRLNELPPDIDLRPKLLPQDVKVEEKPAIAPAPEPTETEPTEAEPTEAEPAEKPGEKPADRPKPDLDF